MTDLLLHSLRSLVGVVLVSWVSSLDCSRRPWPPSWVLWLPPPASGHCGRKGDLIPFCHSCPCAEKKEHSGLAPCLCTSLGRSISLSAGPLALPQTQPSALLLGLQGHPSTPPGSPPESWPLSWSQSRLSRSLYPLPLCSPSMSLPLWPTGWSTHWSL